jgi:hypothetical protein
VEKVKKKLLTDKPEQSFGLSEHGKVQAREAAEYSLTY